MYSVKVHSSETFNLLSTCCGFVVEIRNVLVQIKPSGDEDKWRPTTPR